MTRRRRSFLLGKKYFFDVKFFRFRFGVELGGRDVFMRGDDLVIF